MNAKEKYTRILFIRLAIFAVGMVLLSSATIFAQDTRIITLQHGTETTVFYGDRFSDAHNAAVDGDIITFSAGTFSIGSTITKAVKIQGAGYISDMENNKYITVLKHSLSSYTIDVRLPDGSEGMLIEGIYFDTNIVFREGVESCIIKKCKIKEIDFGSSGSQKSCTIEQCRIDNLYIRGAENFYVKNSAIKSFTSSSSAGILLVENCNIYDFSSPSANLRNNIFFRSVGLSGCTAYNNVFFEGNADAAPIKSGNMTATANNLFGKSIDFNNDETFIYPLTSAAAMTYLGTDGTQVGIYGSSKPFTDVPTNPQITDRTIGTSSTTAGKLNVNITVKAQ